MRMFLILAAVAQVTVIPKAIEPRRDYPIRAVPLISVRIADGFRAPKREINRHHRRPRHYTDGTPPHGPRLVSVGAGA
jgi:hypothetical protein